MTLKRAEIANASRKNQSRPRLQPEYHRVEILRPWWFGVLKIMICSDLNWFDIPTSRVKHLVYPTLPWCTLELGQVHQELRMGLSPSRPSPGTRCRLACRSPPRRPRRPPGAPGGASGGRPAARPVAGRGVMRGRMVGKVSGQLEPRMVTCDIFVNFWAMDSMDETWCEMEWYT